MTWSTTWDEIPNMGEITPSVDGIMKQLLCLFPNMEVGEDMEGQLIIYTGLKTDGTPL